MASEREKARPHVRPPTSKARGMVKMMVKRKAVLERNRRSIIVAG